MSKSNLSPSKAYAFDYSHLAVQPISTEEFVETAFSRFKFRLHTASVKFLESKQQKSRSRVQEILSSGRKTPTIELISMPQRNHPFDEGNNNQEDYASFIREEESRLMHYEDERRRMVIAEQSLEHSMHMSQQLFQNIAAPTDLYPPPRGLSQEANPPANDEIDIDSAFRFLAQSRILQINDRSPKEYAFVLTDLVDESEPNFGESKGSQVKFAFEWREPSPFSSDNFPVGFILLEDIANVQLSSFDPSAFVISIVESTKALKNSKGRTMLVVKCSIASDSISYVKSLNAVIEACNS
jgi:hypothetical protein